MRLREIICEDAKPTDVLYHVTHTSKIPSIKKKGITLMNTTNWVQSGSKKRYGSGEIYCYDHELDALRGAARMDWGFNSEMGSGKISVVEFFRSNQKWEQDNNDPLTQFGRKGMWLKMDQPVSPAQIIKTYPFTSEIARSLTRRLNENEVQELMKINEVTINEAWFSKKQEETPKQTLTSYTDAVLDRYAKKYGKQHGVVEFDNRIGNALRDVIAMGIYKDRIVPQFDQQQIKAAVDHFITDSYINFKLNGQIDDVAAKKDFHRA